MFPRPATPGSEIDEAGGAYVRRRLAFGERTLIAGDKLTAEEIAGIPRANLHSLVNTNIIELYPRSPVGDGIPALLLALWLAENPPPPPAGDYYMLSEGDKFHIVQGKRVTDKPLTGSQARAKMKELSS